MASSAVVLQCANGVRSVESDRTAVQLSHK